MALTKYSYTKYVNLSVLEDEVLADPGITTTVHHLDSLDDAVDVWFVDAISGPEETVLDAVVAAHTNPSTPPVVVNICHSGSGAPDDDLGEDGDIYFDPGTLLLYTKESGEWDAGQQIDSGPDTADDLTDVDTTTDPPSVGEALEWDGTNWVPGTGTVGPQGPAGADGDITWEGAWASQDYTANQAVEYNGTAYACHTNTTSSQVPTDTNYWDLLAAKGDTGATGSVEFDDQYAASQTDTSTTSTTWVDMNIMTLTTSNTQALDYLVQANISIEASLVGKMSEYRFLADGVEMADSVMLVDMPTKENRMNVQVLGRVNLTTGKVIKLQYKTEGGTLTVHERNISARGAA